MTDFFHYCVAYIAYNTPTFAQTLQINRKPSVNKNEIENDDKIYERAVKCTANNHKCNLG